MEGGQIDPAPIWTDLKTFPCEQFKGMVGCLVAGYPCQPFSAAGNRQGAKDEKGRHLWPYIQRAIAVIRPRFIFCENVAGHLTLGLKDVLHDLSELDYEVTCGLFTARAEGLPHKRQRLFILAHDKGAGTRLDVGRLRRQPCEADGQDLPPAGPGLEQFWWEPARVLANNHGGGFVQCGKQDGKEEEQGQQAPFRHDPGGCNAELGHAASLYAGQSKRGCGDKRKPKGCSQEREGFRAESTRSSETELGNAASERPRGGGEDGAGEQAEVPGQGLEHRGVGQADSARNSKQGFGNRQGKKQSRGSCAAQHRHETVTPLGGGADGLAGGLVEPDLLATYSALGSSCHSRTDELRAAGNGVIPACAATAWTTLYKELME